MHSLECFARIITAGFIIDPETKWSAVGTSIIELRRRPVPGQPAKLTPYGDSTDATKISTSSINEKMTHTRSESASSTWRAAPPSKPRQFFSFGIPEAPFQVAVERQRAISKQGHAYLRHSWNRVDFVAVVSFWIMFTLSITGQESKPNAHIYIFRALSVLRLSRLLAITSGTTVRLLDVILCSQSHKCAF